MTSMAYGAYEVPAVRYSVGAPANDDHWFTWSPNILGHRNVIQCVLGPFRPVAFLMVLIASPYLLSLGLSKLGLRGGPTVRVYHATTYWQVRVQLGCTSTNNILLWSGTLANNSTSRFGPLRCYLQVGIPAQTQYVPFGYLSAFPPQNALERLFNYITRRSINLPHRLFYQCW